MHSHQGSRLPAALSYARLGLRVFPLHWFSGGRCSCGKSDCRRPGKHPLTQRGRKGATDSEETIRHWWKVTPRANIGIALDGGEVALDIDPGHEGCFDCGGAVRDGRCWARACHRWQFVCWACGRHFATKRTDAQACSNSCRVKLARAPSLQEFVSMIRNSLNLTSRGGGVTVPPPVDVTDVVSGVDPQAVSRCPDCEAYRCDCPKRFHHSADCPAVTGESRPSVAMGRDGVVPVCFVCRRPLPKRHALVKLASGYEGWACEGCAPEVLHAMVEGL